MPTIPDQMPDLVTRPAPALGQRLSCLFGMHEWTSRIDLGAEPESAEVERDVVGYFFRFAAPVCRYCPRQLPPRKPK